MHNINAEYIIHSYKNPFYPSWLTEIIKSYYCTNFTVLLIHVQVEPILTVIIL